MLTQKTHQELLFDLVNQLNHRTVPFSAVMVGSPLPNTYPDLAGEVVVIMSARPGTPYTGFIRVPYTRMDLAEVFASASITELHLQTNAVTTRDLVPAIRDAYGLNLFPEDIIDEPLTFDADGLVILDLQADPGSYLYRGSISAMVEEVVGVDLSTALTVTVLNGLTYELSSKNTITLGTPA